MASQSSNPPLSILLSWPYVDRNLQTLLTYHDKVRFLLDSGAFTAWKQKLVLDVDAYCDFIRQLPVTPWRYFVLDVVGDPVKTRSNYERMLKADMKPIPIFTRGEDPSVLDFYYQTSDVVAVGGLVGTPRNEGFVKGIMEFIGDRRCHWLGFTRQRFINHYRPYMVDSTSWESGAWRGFTSLYTRRGRFVKFSEMDCRRKPSTEILDAIRSYGFDPTRFARRDAWHGGPCDIRRLNGYSVARYSVDVERHLGTKFFVAICNPDGFRFVIDGHRRETLRMAA